MLSLKSNQVLIEEHKNFFINILTIRIDRIISLEYLNKDGNRISLSPYNKVFLEYIKKETVLEKIISASPLQLKAIIRWISIYFPDGNDKRKPLYIFLYNIFVDHGYKQLDKFDFMRNSDLKTCPYCNRNYIYTIDENRNIKGEIDHFYPKDLYPILGVSYHNLIPSCQTCNGLNAKGNKDSYLKKLKNPYDMQVDDIRFNFKINSSNIFNPLKDEESIDIYFEKELSAYNDFFSLNLLYKEHRDIVLELYLKVKHEYVRGYIDYLYSYEGLAFSDEDIYRFITCGYRNENDLHKRPLSKLVRDISEELGLLR